MTRLAWRGALAAILIFAGASSPPAAATGEKIVLTSDGHTAEIPLDGLKSNQEAANLARQIAVSQQSLSQWREGLDTNDPKVRRLVQLVATLQGDSIEQLDAGYKTAITTSAGFPGQNSTSVQQLLALSAKIMSRPPQFEDRVVTHISTLVPDAAIHFRKYHADRTVWSTYTDGQVMDIGAYYFRVTPRASRVFEERVVVIDSPHSQRIAP